MISSGLIHGVGTLLPPQKRSSVETQTRSPTRTAARVGRRIGGSCRDRGRRRRIPFVAHAARRSEGDGPGRAPGGARARGRAPAGRGWVRGGGRAGGRRGRVVSGRGLRGGRGSSRRGRLRRGRGGQGGEAEPGGCRGGLGG